MMIPIHVVFIVGYTWFGNHHSHVEPFDANNNKKHEPNDSINGIMVFHHIKKMVNTQKSITWYKYTRTKLPR
jgi:hypothetical protein